MTDHEVQSARNGSVATDLFVVHTVMVTGGAGNRTPSGGEIRIVRDWMPADDDLAPTAYTYRIPHG